MLRERLRKEETQASQRQCTARKSNRRAKKKKTEQQTYKTRVLRSLTKTQEQYSCQTNIKEQKSFQHSHVHVEQGRSLYYNLPFPFSTFLKSWLRWLCDRGGRLWLWSKSWSRCPCWGDHSRGSRCSHPRLGELNALACGVHRLYRINATWKGKKAQTPFVSAQAITQCKPL